MARVFFFEAPMAVGREEIAFAIPAVRRLNEEGFGQPAGSYIVDSDYYDMALSEIDWMERAGDYRRSNEIVGYSLVRAGRDDCHFACSPDCRRSDFPFSPVFPSRVKLISWNNPIAHKFVAR